MKLLLQFWKPTTPVLETWVGFGFRREFWKFGQVLDLPPSFGNQGRFLNPAPVWETWPSF